MCSACQEGIGAGLPRHRCAGAARFPRRRWNPLRRGCRGRQAVNRAHQGKPRSRCGIHLTLSVARRAGAVNTCCARGNRWHGDPTDGIALVGTSPTATGWTCVGPPHAGDRCPVVRRAGVRPRPCLMRTGSWWWSTARRARPMRERAMGEPGSRAITRYLNTSANWRFELIANASSAGHYAPRRSICRCRWSTAYHRGDSTRRSSHRLHRLGAFGRVPHVLDGLGILVEQAAESLPELHAGSPQTDACTPTARTDALAGETEAL